MDIGNSANEIIKELHNAVVAGDKDKAIDQAKITLEKGMDPYRTIVDGVYSAMQEANKLFYQGKYFPTDILLCGDAFYAAMDILKPHVKDTHTKGKIIIGTVEGDSHDLAKNMVKIMLEASGWTVYDLGKNVPAYIFAEEMQRVNADVVALSAMNTAIAQAIPTTIRRIREQNPNVPIIVGGAPLSREAAIHFGADGYADSCATAVEEVDRLVSQKKGK